MLIICLSVSSAVTLVARKENSSALLSSMHRISGQFPGMALNGMPGFNAQRNQACPPSLSQMGKLRTASKSDLVVCLENLLRSQENASNPKVQVIILDGPALMNML